MTDIGNNANDEACLVSNISIPAATEITHSKSLKGEHPSLYAGAGRGHAHSHSARASDQSCECILERRGESDCGTCSDRREDSPNEIPQHFFVERQIRLEALQTVGFLVELTQPLYLGRHQSRNNP